MDYTAETAWNLVLFFFRDEFAFYFFVAGLIISFVLSFAVGANDSANSWGTSVGAKTISLGWAFFLGSILEVIGCTFLSGDVMKKIVDGIVNIDMYKSNRSMVIDEFIADENASLLYEEKILAIGCLSVMIGSGIWQLIASAFSWPVSGTHCIIFGLLGFTVTAKGNDGIKDMGQLINVIVGLFVSIIASVFASALIYGPIYKFCIRNENQHSTLNRIVYGVLTGLATGVPVTFVVYQVDKVEKIFRADIPFSGLTMSILIGLAVSCVVSVFAIVYLLPVIRQMKGNLALDFNLSEYLKKKLTRRKTDKESGKLIELCESAVSLENGPHNATENEELVKIFRPLQVLSAMQSALVHGGNDVANCIGPFVTLYYIYQEGIVADSGVHTAPKMILLWGGLGIVSGFVMFGHKVIKTVGTNISEMNSSRGFCVEWASSIVMLLGTVLGYPLSTTHCKVGGVIGAGLVHGLVETNSPKMALKYVNFRVLIGVLMSWVLTIPFAFGLSSLVFLTLKTLVL